MQEKQRVNLMLDADVIAALDGLAGGERKRGMYVSNLVRAAAAAHQQNANVTGMDVEGLRLMVIGLAGRVIAVEGAQTHVQSQLAALMANQR